MSEREQASGGPAHTERGLERLVFFSDAVVAIAITLIALPLVDTARGVAESSTSKFLADNSYALTAAGISFLVISAFWREHHRLFERATGYTSLLIRVNMLWLLTMVALPVATVLDVYSHHDDRLAIGIYVGVIVFAMAIARLEELLLYRGGLLTDAEELTPTYLASRWLTVAAALLALVVAVAVPSIGLWSLLILVVAAPLPGAVRRRWPGTDGR
ncbi:TMEM175 family protein [Nocardia sp. CDC160]|uniref:TMEM175 family protein n=1 Tax=Nocardia sp. CDC160 TaxID=3112166 RepID=UPI002DBB02FC|nr:TMEM175 family protein [Nocardia sp. CDC160]MEC3916804.1 TMEM175 family protein [Nocardia sp. CDC160]